MTDNEELMRQFLEDKDFSTKKEKPGGRWVSEGEVEVELPVKAGKTSRPGRPKKDEGSVFMPTVAITRQTGFTRSQDSRDPAIIVEEKESKESE